MGYEWDMNVSKSFIIIHNLETNGITWDNPNRRRNSSPRKKQPLAGDQLFFGRCVNI
jgi:hypothetical protein